MEHLLLIHIRSESFHQVLSINKAECHQHRSGNIHHVSWWYYPEEACKGRTELLQSRTLWHTITSLLLALMLALMLMIKASAKCRNRNLWDEQDLNQIITPVISSSDLWTDSEASTCRRRSTSEHLKSSWLVWTWFPSDRFRFRWRHWISFESEAFCCKQDDSPRCLRCDRVSFWCFRLMVLWVIAPSTHTYQLHSFMPFNRRFGLFWAEKSTEN